MIEEKYLPLGTIVLLKEAKKRMMIVGYEVTTEEQEPKTFDYIGCLYPEGVISPDRNLLFNHDQIEKIFFKGYTDEEDISFKNKLRELVNERDMKKISDILITNQENNMDIPILNNQIEVLESTE